MGTRARSGRSCAMSRRVSQTDVDTQRAALRAFIERRRGESPGWSVNDWARRAGIREGTVRNFLMGRSRSLNYETAMKLAAAERVAIAEVLGYGDVTPLRNVRWARVFDPEILTHREPFVVPNTSTDNATFIPVVTACETIAAIPVTDTAMNRQIPSGSFVAFDYSDTHPEDGRLYVALVNEVPVVRRFRDRDGALRFEADSTEPWPTLYPRQGYRIIGRVIWFGALLK